MSFVQFFVVDYSIFKWSEKPVEMNFNLNSLLVNNFLDLLKYNFRIIILCNDIATLELNYFEINLKNNLLRITPLHLPSECLSHGYIPKLTTFILDLSRNSNIDLCNSYFISDNQQLINIADLLGCKSFRSNSFSGNNSQSAVQTVAKITTAALSAYSSKPQFITAQSSPSNDLRAHYALEAPSYDISYHRRLDKLCDSMTWRFLQPYIPSEGIVADIGGGTGNWASRLATISRNVVLIDISTDMLIQAQDKQRESNLQSDIALVCADVASLPLPDGSLNFCLAEGDVLSYCHDVSKALAELSRVLCIGSRIVFSIENLLYRAFLAFQKGWAPSDIKEILETGYIPFPLLDGSVRNDINSKGFLARAFTPSSITRLLFQHAFEVEVIVPKPLFSSLLGYAQVEKIDSFSDSDLLELETLLAGHSDVSALGFHLHVVARRVSQLPYYLQ